MLTFAIEIYAILLGVHFLFFKKLCSIMKYEQMCLQLIENAIIQFKIYVNVLGRFGWGFMDPYKVPIQRLLYKLCLIFMYILYGLCICKCVHKST